MARTPTPLEVQKIQAALSAGDKIEAIKLCREFTGLGLAEAKAYVEGLAAPVLDIKGETPTGDSTPAVNAAIFSGKTLQAIKLYRETHPGMGLKEAKDIVEKMAEELYTKDPRPFTHPPKKAGCTSVFIFGFLAVSAAILLALMWLP